MSIFELILIAIGLSMDAFAVAICKGLSMKKINVKHLLIIALFFGGFQALMPMLGYLLGSQFEQSIKSIDHWVAFILLGLIGYNMIKESLSKGEVEEPLDEDFSIKNILLLAIATSIDALAVGISFAFLGVDMLSSITLIGVITFIISGIGVVIGYVFGLKFKSKAEFMGGLILIAIGLKILLEHLAII